MGLRLWSAPKMDAIDARQSDRDGSRAGGRYIRRETKCVVGGTHGVMEDLMVLIWGTIGMSVFWVRRKSNPDSGFGPILRDQGGAVPIFAIRKCPFTQLHSQPIDDGRRVPSPPYINRLSTHVHHALIKYTGLVKSGTHARDHGGGSTGTNAKNGIQSSTIFGPTLSKPPFELMSW
jgi:hypothetical protein